MSTRERPLDLIRGGKNLSMGELTRMANAVERITTMQGSNLIQGANGLMVREPNTTKIWAKISAKDASDPIKYTWEQVWPDGVGGWLEETDAPSGDSSSTPAYEGNQLDVDLTSPLYTELFIYNDSMLFFSPTAEGVVEPPALASITVEEQDGSPSYTGITTIQVNQADGFALTQPGAGEALISIADASASSPGIVTTGAQNFAGAKLFQEYVTITGPYGLYLATSAGSNHIYNYSDAPGYTYQQAVYEFSAIGSDGPGSNDVLAFGMKSFNDGSGSVFSFSDSSETLFYVSNFITDTLYIFGEVGQTGTYAGLDFTCGILTGGTFSGGSGTVTSVGITQPAAGITVSGSPVTTSGAMTLALADDLAALEALTGTDTIYRRSGTSTWSVVTYGPGMSFASGVLKRTGIGASIYPGVSNTTDIPNATLTTISMGATLYDTSSMKSGNTLVIPTGMGGLWDVNVVWFSYFNTDANRAGTNTGGVSQAYLLVNGSASRLFTVPSGYYDGKTYTLELAAGDVLSMQVYHAIGSSIHSYAYYAPEAGLTATFKGAT